MIFRKTDTKEGNNNHRGGGHSNRGHHGGRGRGGNLAKERNEQKTPTSDPRFEVLMT